MATNEEKQEKTRNVGIRIIMVEKEIKSIFGIEIKVIQVMRHYFWELGYEPENTEVFLRDLERL